MVDIKENYKCDLGVKGLTPWSDWHLIKFSLQYYPWIKDDSHENRGNDHLLRKLLIFQQILLLGVIGNVLRTIRRICVLILRGKKLANRSLESSPPREQTTGRERALIPEGWWYNFSVIWKRRSKMVSHVGQIFLQIYISTPIH